jgi:hypothetical protein
MPLLPPHTNKNPRALSHKNFIYVPGKKEPLGNVPVEYKQQIKVQ